MRFTNLGKQRRTEDAGSAGCPPLSASCTTNPEGHDLTPAQASSISQSLAASSLSATSTAFAANSGGEPAHKHVNPQAIGGIIVIIFLFLAFTSAICYVAFGIRGERCCCRKQKDTRRQTVQWEGGQIPLSAPEVKQGSEARLIQHA